MLETERTLKLIWGNTEEEQARAAEEVFQRPVSELKRISIADGNEPERAALFCPEGDWAQYENMDAEFRLYSEENGVYLELIPKQGQGAEMDLANLREYLRRKNLSELAEENVKKLVEIGWGREKIAPPQELRALNEEITITVAEDEMSVNAMLLPPESGGILLTMRDVEAALRTAGVVNGLDQEKLEVLLRDRPYGRPICVAQGKLPQDGADGSLTFHFNRQHDGTPWLDDETGRADFKKLDWIEQVREGDLLVSRIPATAGSPGYTVYGKTLTPRFGKECRLPRGQKVRYNEDRTEMYAAVSGRVECKDDVIQVASVYEISGDVDLSVGNIDFNGTVVVHGNVISGMAVRATGDITIYGGVQDASVEAGGNVTIMNGLQGRGQGRVSAQGILSAKFIEQSRVRAGALVRADEIVHSEVDSDGDVQVTGKHGSIVGGVIHAYHMVAAQTVGAVGHPRTVIEVGTNPEMAKRRKDLGLQLEKNRKKLEDVQKIVSYLIPRSGEPGANQERLQQAFATKVSYLQIVQSMEKEYTELQKKLEGAGNGVIHVLDTIYPGAVLRISNLNYNVSRVPIKKTTFKISEREIRLFPCDYVNRGR